MLLTDIALGYIPALGGGGILLEGTCILSYSIYLRLLW